MVSLSLLTAGPVSFFPKAAAAVEEVSPEQALDIFFQLGLPDTRGAKWVKAYGPGISHREMLPGRIFSGNAWLVRDEADGRVELITIDGRRLTGRNGRAAAPATGTATAFLSVFHIQAADLDRDLKTIAAALQQEEIDVASIDISQGYRRNEARQKAGGALLLLAQLHRQERATDVRPLLRDLLAHQQSPEMVVDCAISLLADARLAQCTEQWTQRGDSAAYAESLEKLTVQFPRGWENREAVQLLIRKVRQQKPSPAIARPEVKKAADLFLNLTLEQFRQLPRRTNWLLGAEGGGATIAFESDEFIEIDDSLVEATTTTSTPASTGPVKAFFQQKRQAAEILASLIEDERFMRISGDADSGYRSYYFSSTQSPEEKLREAYEQLPRPKTVGEIAWTLIEPLIPRRSGYGSDEDPSARSARASAWLEGIRSLSDEELAWQYLRESTSPHDSNFRTPLTYLVQHGGEETQQKLREVFLDPAVWHNGNVDSIVPLLEPYLKRMTAKGEGTDSFGEKLKAVVTKAIKGDGEGDGANVPGLEMDEEDRKQMAAHQAAQLRKLDQLLKPRSFKEILAELSEATTPEETQAAMAVIGTAAQSTPFSELEPAVYQAAAAAKNSESKRQLLTMLQMTRFQQSRGAKAPTPPGPPPSDPATRAALKQLLEDNALPEEDDPYGRAPQSIADLTASVLVSSRFSNAQQQSWTALWQQSPDIATLALKAHALALASGQTPPAPPNAANVPAEEAKKIVEELSALPSAKVIESLRTKTLDQQLAVVLHLKDAPEWPKTIRDAHFTIVSVSANDEEAAFFKSDAWSGRQLDDATRREIEAALIKATLEKNPLAVSIASKGPLSGLTLSARPNVQEYSAEMLGDTMPGLDGKPAPIAAVYQVLQLGATPYGGQHVAFAIPLWSDAAITEAWKKEHLKFESAQPAAANDAPEENDRPNPQLFAKRMAELQALKADLRGPFTLQWHAFNFTQSSDDEEEP